MNKFFSLKVTRQGLVGTGLIFSPRSSCKDLTFAAEYLFSP